MIECAFVRLPNGSDLHVRFAGNGPPLVILHPSPLHSGFMAPWIHEMAKHFSVFAFDTPGYGESDPLPTAEHLEDYVPAFEAGCEQLGLERVVLFGQATGAQLAIAWAKRHPERIQQLYLDAACHFEPEQLAHILGGYFPTLAPRRDGSHLPKIWHIVQRTFQFFPWFETRDSARVDRPAPPVAVLHAMAMGYLRAGRDYARAYRLAFRHEHAAHLAGLTVPCYVIQWPASLVHRYTLQLLAQTLPSTVKALPLTCDAAARASVLCEHMRERGAGQGLKEASASAPDHPERGYVSWQGQRIHWRWQTTTSGATRRMLNLLPIGAASASSRSPGLHFDWPGHGLSTPLRTSAREVWESLPRFIAEHFSLPVPATCAFGAVPMIVPELLLQHRRLAVDEFGTHLAIAWQLAERQELRLLADDSTYSIHRVQAGAYALLQSADCLSQWLPDAGASAQ